mmetsp:Transcript_80504/g.167760  ORF Transcript_80504/g.167760 Transcript_80504/m.167760 type:complete len:90 (-) Transcript_80504:87-356(-)
MGKQLDRGSVVRSKSKHCTWAADDEEDVEEQEQVAVDEDEDEEEAEDQEGGWGKKEGVAITAMGSKGEHKSRNFKIVEYEVKGGPSGVG